MRVQYLGGLWANAEDEVLKAAVMKYGMNQWARIASLLPRKSAKQCKARWCEWLSPDIRKTEWTREEEERLLHLAKILPTQWRTIAPMIGRTAAQCLEHYEYLLEDAQRTAGAGSSSNAAGGSAAATAGSSKETLDANGERRRFDHDTPAETRPARPDAVDMNEEEKEMLSEARARLANTRGKKAKRKAREKQLEAAKRLASLQKSRELKAAGIEVKPKKRKKGEMDLTTEIPYMMEPVPGFYDTKDEDDAAARDKRDARGLGRLIDKYEDDNTSKTRDLAEKREAAKRRFVFGDPGDKPKKPGGSAAGGLPPLKRSRLSLPAPQVSDADLESIAKANLPSSTRTAYDGPLKGSFNQAPGADGLLSTGRHPVLATPTPSVTSSVPPTPSSVRGGRELWSETRDRQLRDIMKLQSAPTPLIGGDNSALPDSLEVDGSVTPREPPRTPNLLGTPSSISNASIATRDMEDAELAKLEKARLQLVKQELKEGLDALPDPENEYQLSVPAGAADGGHDDDDDEESDGMVEDAEEEVKRFRRESAALLKSVRTRALSTAAQRDLPIPPLVDSHEELDAVTKMLVERDVTVTNILSDTDLGDAELARKVREALGLYDDCSEHQLAGARALVDEEVEKARAHPSSDASDDAPCTEEDILAALKEQQRSSTKQIFVEDDAGRVVPAESPAELARVFRQRAAHVKLAHKSGKAQRKKLAVLLGGYEAKWNGMREELADVWAEITKSREELVCFQLLQQAEDDAVDRRVAEWEGAVDVQRQLEARLQAEYGRRTGRV